MRLSATLTMLAVLVVAPAARADAGAPLDPERVVSQFRRAYHKRAFVEALEITVQTASEQRRETVTVRASAKGEIRVDLGELTFWTDGPRLLGVHRLNAAAYYEAPLDPADRAGSLLAALPPVPIPQVALVLQPTTAPPAGWVVSPLCPEPRWDRATAAHRRGRPAVVLEGSHGHAQVRVAGVGDPPLIVFADTRSMRDGVAITVFAHVTRLDEPVGRIDADLRGRGRVAALSDLREATPDVRAGLAMPDLIAEPLERTGARGAPLVPSGRACVLVIFDATRGLDGTADEETTEGTPPGGRRPEGGEIGAFVRGLRGVASRGGESVAFRVLAAASLTRTTARGEAEALMKSSAPGAGYVSFSPETTLGRFVPWSNDHGGDAGVSAGAARAVAVVIDGTGLVSAVVPMGGADAARDVAAALERAR